MSKMIYRVVGQLEILFPPQINLCHLSMPQPFNNCAAINQPPAITNLNSQDANEAIESEASSIPNNDLDEEVCTQQVVDLSTCHHKIQ